MTKLNPHNKKHQESIIESFEALYQDLLNEVKIITEKAFIVEEYSQEEFVKQLDMLSAAIKDKLEIELDKNLNIVKQNLYNRFSHLD